MAATFPAVRPVASVTSSFVPLTASGFVNNGSVIVIEVKLSKTYVLSAARPMESPHVIPPNVKLVTFFLSTAYTRSELSALAFTPLYCVPAHVTPFNESPLKL